MRLLIGTISVKAGGDWLGQKAVAWGTEEPDTPPARCGGGSCIHGAKYAGHPQCSLFHPKKQQSALLNRRKEQARCRRFSQEVT